MENQRSNGQPDPGMYGSDRDLFLRVWDRVMPVERTDSMITVEHTEKAARPVQEPVERPMSSADWTGDDFPAREDVPCLGNGGQADLGKLQEMIRQELFAWRGYQALARRGGQGGRTLAALAAGCRRRAKRLSAALFLISGVRFWPAEQVSVPMPRSYLGALRDHFLSEQDRGQAYRAAAEECRDVCLCALYLDLADDCADHTCRIRTLLENT